MHKVGAQNRIFTLPYRPRLLRNRSL